MIETSNIRIRIDRTSSLYCNTISFSTKSQADIEENGILGEVFNLSTADLSLGHHRNIDQSVVDLDSSKWITNRNRNIIPLCKLCVEFITVLMDSSSTVCEILPQICKIWATKKSIHCVHCTPVGIRTTANRIAEYFQRIKQILRVSTKLYFLVVQSLIKEPSESILIIRISENFLILVD